MKDAGPWLYIQNAQINEPPSQTPLTVGSYQMAHLFNCWLVHICCKNQQNNQNEPSDKGAI